MDWNDLDLLALDLGLDSAMDTQVCGLPDSPPPPLAIGSKASNDVVSLWRVGKPVTTATLNNFFKWPTDVAYLPSGYIAVADYNAQCVSLFDRCGERRMVIGKEEVKPFCVTSTCEATLLVTDQLRRCVVEYADTGEYVMSHGLGSFDEPSGIAAFRDGTWAATDTRRHSVNIYDGHGNLLRRFGERGAGKNQFHWPAYCCTDSKGRLIVSDTNNQTVKIFDSTGQYLKQLTPMAERSSDLLFPKGICVDPMGNILVVDWGNSRVAMYSPDGRFIRHIMTWSDTRMDSPHGIDVDCAGYVALTARAPWPSVAVFKYNCGHPSMFSLEGATKHLNF